MMKNIFEIGSNSAQATMNLGKKLAGYLKKGDIVFLSGDLGAGKTTFVKGIAQGLGIDPDKVSSPTFVIMSIYEGSLDLYHFDLYRLEDQQSLRSIEFDEFFYGEGISVVEWPQRLKEFVPKEYLDVKFSHKAENERSIGIVPQGRKYEAIIDKLREK